VQLLPIDLRNPIKAIYRALQTELNIKIKDIKKIKHITKNIDMRVSKQYSDEPKSLYNREFVHTVIVQLHDKVKIKPNKDKVYAVKWYDYNKFKKDALKYPLKYAKNLRSNFVNQHLDRLIYKRGCEFVGIQHNIPKNNLIKSSYYSPPNNKDVAISKFSDGKCSIQSLKMDGTITEKFIYNSIPDKYFKCPNLIYKLKG
jgi:hypothetical protein